jgi:hypothetical protein
MRQARVSMTMLLARGVKRRLVCRRVMRLALGIAAAALLVLFCSCDKHHVGELPEVQKERVDLAAESEHAPVRSTSPSENEPAPTPAEFFSPKPSP